MNGSALSGADRAEDLSPPASPCCYYTPLIVMGGMLTVGHTAALSRVADPWDLRATRAGGPGSESSRTSRVVLRWQWAQEASSTRLVARQGSPPIGPADPIALVATVTRAEYDRLGFWTISLPRAGAVLDEPSDFELQPLEGADSAQAPISDSWHVRAYSIAEVDGGFLVSPGIEPTAATAVPGPHPQVTVSYSLKRPWFPGRSWAVTMHTEPAGLDVPPMVLVANPRAVPVSAEDGEIVARLPAGPDGTTHAIRSGLNLSRSELRAFLDPTVDPGSLPPIRLRHPETGFTRV